MKREDVSLLFGFYEKLLTDKQRNYIELYYFEDYSQVEIAKIYNISRSAVSDNLKKVIKNLEDYELKLKLCEKYNMRNIIYEKLKIENNIDLIKELEKIE